MPLLFFASEDGKIQSIIKYNNAEGNNLYSDLGEENYLVFNTHLYVKADIDPEYVYHDYSTRFGPRVVLTISDPVLDLWDEDNFEIGGFIAFIRSVFGDGAANAVANNAEVVTKALVHYVDWKRDLPDAAAFGIKSNILRYGPWGFEGPHGASKVEVDEGLVPSRLSAALTSSTCLKIS